MKTINDRCENVIEIKKSKFISYAIPVMNEEEVHVELERLRAEHKSATHVTYAYCLYSPSIEKCSDDGEPGGTAGKPILENIKRKNLQNVLVVVVRYFGGIKLGSGGLVRAYSNSAKDVLDKADVRECHYHKIISLEISLDNKYMIENDKDIIILDTDYSQIGSKSMIYTVAVRSDSDNVTMLGNISKSMTIIDEKLM